MFRWTTTRSGMVLCLGVLALVATPVDAAESSHAPDASLVTTAGVAAAPAAVPATAALEIRPLTPRMHQAPLPSAVLAGVALLSITAAHGFGRPRRRRG